MENIKKKFEVVECVPAFIYVTYHVEAEDEEQAIHHVMNMDSSAVRIGETTADSDYIDVTYEVEEIED